MASTLNLSIDQGAYWAYQLTYQDGAGNPIDLTGYEARMMARVLISDAAPVFTLATAGDSLIPAPTGTITLGGAAGTILLELQASESATIGGSKPSKDGYVYDLELIPPNGEVIRLVEGIVTVSPEVTR